MSPSVATITSTAYRVPCPYLSNKARHNPLLWWYAQPFTCISSGL